MRKTWSCLAIVLAACARQSQPARPSAGEATAGIDSLNAALVHAYRTHDPLAYAALYTDTAGFEGPAVNTGRGPPQLAAMARSKWASPKDMGLRPTLPRRPAPPGHST